jgi:tetratricopeptide (TPR) repeat protein
MSTAGQPDAGDVWLHQSRTEAEAWLPRLLDLSGPDLREAVAAHPELQPCISQLLLDLAESAVDRDPARAHELTAAVIEQAGVGLPSSHAWMAPYLRGQAWTAHAAALLGLRRPIEALAAINVAFEVYTPAPVNDWHLASAEVVEAQILHELGELAEALRLIRRAAEVILAHGALERYAQLRMLEALMLWKAGHRHAAANVWQDAARKAFQRRDLELMAILDCRMGVFHLRHGNAAVAAHHFSSAHALFEKRGLVRQAARARWRLAEVAVARGRLNEAISEYYKVQAVLVAHGDLPDAAIACTEILKLLLRVGRDREAVQLAELLIRTFAEAGQQNGMQAWTLIRDCASAGDLTHDRIRRLKRYFQDLPLRPNARFE